MRKTNTQEGRRLKGRDFITTGIFLALYFILMMIPMIISGIHPILWVLFPGFAGILCAVPFMLLCARVQKPLCVLIMGVVICLLFAMTGYFTLAVVMVLCTAAIAEVVRWCTGYASYLGNAVAYVFFAYGMTCSPLPIWLYNESFMAQISNQGMSAEYVAACAQVSDPLYMAICLVFTAAGAIIGVALTRMLFKKHFAKAGLA